MGSLNDIIQTGGIILALILCVVWIVRHIRNNHACKDDNGCAGCQLSEHCRKRKEL